MRGSARGQQTGQRGCDDDGGQPFDVIVTAVDRERRRLSLAPAPAGDAEDAAAAPVAPRSLGTLGDLLKQKPKQKKR